MIYKTDRGILYRDDPVLWFWVYGSDGCYGDGRFLHIMFTKMCYTISDIMKAGVAEFRAYMTAYLCLHEGESSTDYIWCNTLYGDMILNPEKINEPNQ